MTSGPAYSDIKAGCSYLGNVPPQQGLLRSVPTETVGGSSTQSWPSCIQYPNGDADCYNKTYPPGMNSYIAARTISRETIGPTAAYASENNCNNFKQDSTSITTDLDPLWASMSIVSPGANYT